MADTQHPAKKQRKDKNAGQFGWCPKRVCRWCKVEGENENQWTHRPNWKLHNNKHHIKEGEAPDKWYLDLDNPDYIPGCVRCSEGFWQKADLNRHVTVRPLLSICGCSKTPLPATKQQLIDT